jgi:hypothetical protein
VRRIKKVLCLLLCTVLFSGCSFIKNRGNNDSTTSRELVSPILKDGKESTKPQATPAPKAGTQVLKIKGLKFIDLTKLEYTYTEEDYDLESDRIYADLDGDGKEEEIYARLFQTDGDRKIEISVSGQKNLEYFDSPNRLVIYDINDDGLKEILYYDNGPSDDYQIRILRYKGKVLTDLTGYYPIQATDLTIFEGGIFEGDRTRGKTLCTWFHKDRYKIQGDEIVTLPVKLYETDIGMVHEEIFVIKSLKTYKDIDSKEAAPPLSLGERVAFTATDDIKWWKIKREDETQCWINLEDIDYETHEYFENLPFYD